LLPSRYFGIEPEQWLVEEGIENELGRECVRIKRPRFDHNAIFQLSVFGHEFDYIIAHSIFSHASAAQIQVCLMEAAKVMKPTSVFVATYESATENYDGDAWVYPQRVTYTPDFMAAMTRKAGLLYATIPWSHPTQQTWFAAVRSGAEELVRELSGDPLALPILKARLTETQSRLARTRQHPYVRFALWLRTWLRPAANRPSR
jgi:hypothetical protein